MATLERDIQRPAFLDPPPEGQLAFGGAATLAPEPQRVPLSERLRDEPAMGSRTVRSTRTRTDTTRDGGATLDELLVGAWEGLSAHRLVACPVCAGSMNPRTGGAGGACGDCGAQLR